MRTLLSAFLPFVVACSGPLNGKFVVEEVVDTCGFDTDSDEVFLAASCGAEALTEEGKDCSDRQDGYDAFLDLQVMAYWSSNGRWVRCDVPGADGSFDCDLIRGGGETIAWSGELSDDGLVLSGARQIGSVSGGGVDRLDAPYCTTELTLRSRGKDTRGMEFLGLLAAAALVAPFD